MAGLKAITTNTPPEAEPHIFAEDDAAIYQSIVGSDCVFSTGQQCKATVLSNNKIRISDGVLCVGGHFGRIPYGEYEDVTITNGTSGKNRNDIIVVKFVTTGSGGIDTLKCEVVQGVAGTVAVDPTLTKDDIYKAGKIREFPLYRVRIESLSIVKVERLFDITPTIPELNSNLNNILKLGFFGGYGSEWALSNSYVNVSGTYKQNDAFYEIDNTGVTIKQDGTYQLAINAMYVNKGAGVAPLYLQVRNASTGKVYITIHKAVTPYWSETVHASEFYDLKAGTKIEVVASKGGDSQLYSSGNESFSVMKVH